MERREKEDLFPEWVGHADLAGVLRVDVGVEGAWSETVSCAWDASRGFLGLPDDLPVSSGLRPCLELYMTGGWIGLHCFRPVDGGYELDRERTRRVIEAVAAARIEGEALNRGLP